MSLKCEIGSLDPISKARDASGWRSTRDWHFYTALLNFLLDWFFFNCFDSIQLDQFNPFRRQGMRPAGGHYLIDWFFIKYIDSDGRGYVCLTVILQLTISHYSPPCCASWFVLIWFSWFHSIIAGNFDGKEMGSTDSLTLFWYSCYVCPRNFLLGVNLCLKTQS